MTTTIEHVTQLTRLFQREQANIEEDEAYYESLHRLKAIGVSTPPEMRVLLAQIGWPRLYLDSLEERLDLEGFRFPGKDEADTRLTEWWQANDLDDESSLGHTESFKHGRSYVSVSAPDPDDPTMDPDVPVIRVESPKNMYAEVNPITRRVTRAIRLHKSTDSKAINRATLLLPNETIILEKAHNGAAWTVVRTIEHNLGVVLVEPLTNRQSLSERTGKSEITPEIRSVTDAAARTMMNLQAAAELMAVPQRLLFGVAQEALADNPNNPGSVLEAYLARIIAIEDPDGKAFQWAAAELRNFTEVMQELAKQCAAYTGLPPQYLTVSSDNPASADAIRSSETRLIKKAERRARHFGGSWERVMRLALLVMDGQIEKDAFRLEAMWRDPATPTYAAKADAVVKLATATTSEGRAIVPVEQARIDLGYGVESRRQMREWDKDSHQGQLTALFSDAPRRTKPADPALPGAA